MDRSGQVTGKSIKIDQQNSRDKIDRISETNKGR